MPCYLFTCAVSQNVTWGILYWKLFIIIIEFYFFLFLFFGDDVKKNFFLCDSLSQFPSIEQHVAITIFIVMQQNKNMKTFYNFQRERERERE